MSAPLAIADVLDRAASLIEPEGAWTQRAFARNKAGRATGFSGYRGDPVCWCVLGATGHVEGEENSGADHYLVQTLGVAGSNGLAEWNDAPERTQAEVVAALRKAAALARGEAK